MKTKRLMNKLYVLLVTAGCAVSADNAQAQGHWYAGAYSTNQNGQLLEYTNAGSFVAASGYVYWLSPSNSGTYAGLYNGSSPTFTALGNGTTTADSGSGSPFASANGAFLWNRLVSLAGPAGANFYFYDIDIYHTAHTATNAPTFVMPVGPASTNYLFALSDPANGAGAPGGDPYGHMHGRRYGVDKPGTYTLGIQVIDQSTNGTSNGPIQSPSAIYYAMFQAGNLISSITNGSNGTGITFSTLASITNLAGLNTNAVYSLQGTTNLLNSNAWTVVATNVGNSYFQTLTDTNSTVSAKYYRLKIKALGDN